VTHEPDTYPVWTVRLTWRITDQDDKPLYTYDAAENESRAVDRAVFMLDYYRNSGTRELVCAHVRRPDGVWSEVPRSNTQLSAPVLFAFQRPPRRPA
jgi:hypothetical protein